VSKGIRAASVDRAPGDAHDVDCATDVPVVGARLSHRTGYASATGGPSGTDFTIANG